MRNLLAAALFLVPQTALAQDWIDYGLLLRENAEKVTVGKNGNGDEEQILDLGDGVTVHCSGGNCYGQDPQGAIGCNFAILVDLYAQKSICPGVLDDSQTAQLEASFDRLGSFIEANAVPVRAPGYAREVLAAAVARQEEADETGRAAVCKRLTPGPEADLADILTYVASRDFYDTLESALAKPRLPVMNPCL